MADHVITLTAKQEAAAQVIVDNLNLPIGDGTAGAATVDTWLRDVIMAPIRQKIAEMKALNVQVVADAYDSASKAIQNQVRTDLGLPTI